MGPATVRPDVSERRDDERDDAHLAGLEAGAGCTEIWEYLSEQRERGGAAAARSDDRTDADHGSENRERGEPGSRASTDTDDVADSGDHRGEE